MSLNETPVSERVQIGFLGNVNAGKSSIINAITGQNISVVSELKGTTTDTVKKTMELHKAGPVVLIDTPGLSDDGEIGSLRMKATMKALDSVNVAAIVTTPAETDADIEPLIKLCREKDIPYIVVCNKMDGFAGNAEDIHADILVSAKEKTNIEELKNLLEEKIILFNESKTERFIISDKLKKNSLVTLVIPIDESAPKGRLILPQQQVIRDILDAGSQAVCVKDTELEEFMTNGAGRYTDLVITDSQVFKFVDKVVPDNVSLTSFSILMARYKGFLDMALEGVYHIDNLKDGDRVLISEGCSHHRQCEDIGSVKIPKLLKKYTGKELSIELSNGTYFPEDLSGFDLVIHCGGCMLSEKQVLSRMKHIHNSGVKVTNYGIAISYMNGILKRAVKILED